MTTRLLLNNIRKPPPRGRFFFVFSGDEGDGDEGGEDADEGSEGGEGENSGQQHLLSHGVRHSRPSSSIS